MYCSKCGAELKENETVCPTCGEAFEKNDETPKEETLKLGMKWYKFNIYFSLFFVGILTIISGGLKLFNYLNFGLAALYVFYGVFAICTRFALSSYKKKAPLMMVALNIIFSCVHVYDFLYNTVVYVEGTPSSAIILGIVLAILNYVYFNKRKHLFVK